MIDASHLDWLLQAHKFDVADVQQKEPMSRKVLEYTGSNIKDQNL